MQAWSLSGVARVQNRRAGQRPRGVRAVRHHSARGAAGQHGLRALRGVTCATADGAWWECNDQQARTCLRPAKMLIDIGRCIN